MKTLTTLVLSALLTIGCSMTGQVQADDEYFSQAELDSMLAPVALYPDSVLSHVLIAATYPLEVIQAARWSREHPGLRGEDAVAAVEYQDWDPSVKALVAFPELLERMDEDLQWTQRLGDAFLMQEEDVVASIQYLRSEAYSQGHLASNDRVKVVREKQYIYIEPARTRVVYVPYYDPRVVYSSWRWASHPPVYWHRPSGFSVSVGFHWGRPYHVRPNFYFSSFHWATRRVVVVNHHHHYYRDHGFHSGRQVARFDHARHWKHDPTHRRGVSYRGRVEQTRFVDNSRSGSARVSATTNRAVARSERRDWAAERRSSTTFDRNAQSGARANSRSERVAQLRGGDRRSESQVQSRERGDSRVARGSSARGAESSRTSERSRSVTGRAPERAATGSRSSEGRSSASRVSESLRSSSGSRTAATSRARGAERSSGIQNSRESGRSSSSRTSRSDRQSSSVSTPRDLSVRSGSARERSSAPSRSTHSSAPSRGASIGRSSAPSRESAPIRSRSGGRESAPSRSAPRVQSSAPSRDSSSSTPSRGSRSSAPSRSSKSSAPSRSRGASTRSSRGSASSRSRGGDSRRGGGEERR